MQTITYYSALEELKETRELLRSAVRWDDPEAIVDMLASEVTRLKSLLATLKP